MRKRLCRGSVFRHVWPAVVLAALVSVVFCGPVGAGQPPEAYIMRVEGAISQALAEAIKRKVQSAEEEGVRVFILELDTPGGTIEASIDLGDFIFQRDRIDVVAYIHTQAYSGGTMVALACKEVYIDASVGRMGDVAPVMPGGQIVGEKAQVVVRETMLGYARARGYPEALVKAMVTKEIEVFRVQMVDDPEPSYMTGSMLESLSEQDRAKIVSQKLIVPSGELLAMGADRAVEYGFAKAVGSTHALFDALQLEPGKVKRLYLTGSEKLLAFLDVFSPMLIIGGFVLLFMELNHPGFGLPGILGLGCFAAFFIIKWTLHYARLLEILLFVAGLALLLIEIFIIPGFGVVGVGGVALMFISLVLMFQEFGIPSTVSEGTAFRYNLLKVTGSLAGAAVAIAILLRALPALPGLGRIVLRHDLAAARVGEAVERRTPGLSEMVGAVGIAQTPMRPAGRAEFGDTLLHVVSEGDFIEKGARVQIQEIHGSRIVVRPYREV